MPSIVGHDRALATIHQSLCSRRVHHAWIFAGPQGVGKFTAALEMARLLLDPDAHAGSSGVCTADPESETSRLIDAGTHPDLHVVRKELALYSADPQVRKRKLFNIPVDVLREHVIGGVIAGDRAITGPAYRTARRGHGKVFIIDEAELLEEESQNLLLKTLEEPPQQTWFVLVTARPRRLLPTIHSRCQTVRFGRLDAEEVDRVMARSRPELSSADRQWLIAYADGSPGLALLAADFGFAASAARIIPALDRLARGEYVAEAGPMLAEFTETFAEAWVKRNQNASKDAANKDGGRHLIAMIAADVRTRLRSAGAAEFERVVAQIEILRDAERQLAANVNQKQVFEDVAARWLTAAEGEWVSTGPLGGPG